MKKVLILTAILPSLYSVPALAYKGESNFNAEFSYMNFSDDFDSANPVGLFLRYGYQVHRYIAIEGYVGTGLADDVLISEDFGIDSYTSYTKLSQAYGVQAKFLKKLSYKSNLYFAAGYGKTEVDFEDEDCFGGSSVTCFSESYSIAENGINYGLGFNYSGFTMSYNVFFNDTVDDFGSDAQVSGINIGYIGRFN